MKRYIIIDKYGRKLHSNDCFYDCIMGGFGISFLVYKLKKSAQKKASKVNGIVVEICQNDNVRDKIKETLNNLS